MKRRRRREYSELLSFDLATVESSLAGPKRPQDRVTLSQRENHSSLRCPPDEAHRQGRSIGTAGTLRPTEQSAPWQRGDRRDHLLYQYFESVGDGGRRPGGQEGGGEGLTVPPWVKTSLAPGSKVVRDTSNAGLLPYLEKIKFHIVGYGCTTCIGNLGRCRKRFEGHREKEPGGGVGAVGQSKF